MEQLYLSILLIVALFAFLGSGIWVAVSLLAVGFVGIFVSYPLIPESLIPSTKYR